MKEVYYIKLVRKSDNKEVYTCSKCINQDTFEIDEQILKDTFNYYFDRVNSGIQQQLDSPKLTPEQKKQLKLLDKHDYTVQGTKLMPLGCKFQPVFWTKEAFDII